MMGELKQFLDALSPLFHPQHISDGGRPQPSTSTGSTSAIFTPLDNLCHQIDAILDQLDAPVAQEVQLEMAQTKSTFSSARSDNLSVTLVALLNWTGRALQQCHVESANQPAPLLSVAQAQTVAGMAEFMVALGLGPCLEPGVGIPLKSRLCHSRALLVDSKLAVENEPISEADLMTDLYGFNSSLWMLYQTSELKSTISSKFLNDLLSSLLQLCYGTGSAKNLPLRTASRDRLRILIYDIYRPLLVQHFMQLQSGSAEPSPPPWMRQACARLLSNCLLEAQGLLHLLQAMTTELLSDWLKCDGLARVVTACPRFLLAEKTVYYTNVCRQLAELLLSSAYRAQYGCALVAIARQIFIAAETEANSEIFIPIFASILTLCRAELNDLPSSASVQNCIEICHCLYCTGGPLSENSFAKLLYPISRGIFDIYAQLYTSTSELKSPLKDLVFGFLKSAETVDQSVEIFREFSGCSAAVKFGHPLSNLVQISPGPENTLQLSVENDPNLTFEQPNTIIIDLLDQLPLESKNPIIVALFVSLLRDLAGSCDRSNFENSHDFERGLIRLTMVAALIERFMEMVLENRSAILQVSQALLETAALSESKDGTLIEETMTTLLGLLATLLLYESTQETQSNVVEWTKIGEAVYQLSQTSSSAQIRSTAQDLHASLVGIGCGSTQPKSHSGNFVKTEKVDKSEFDKAFDDLDSGLIPARGHALISLRYLVHSKDTQTLQNLDAVQQKAIDLLKEEDSYVYLSAINLLAAIGDQKPRIILPLLLKEFTDWEIKDTPRTPEIRLKIGEVLVKICRELGELAPFYGPSLVSAFLCLCSDPDEYIRASALTNLGELAKLMSFKLTNILSEIVMCCTKLLTFEPSTLVRRAAMHVIRLLLEGCGTQMIEVLGDEMLRIYGVVKKCCQEDQDPTVTLHAGICRDYLDANMWDRINQDQAKLIRTIRLK